MCLEQKSGYIPTYICELGLILNFICERTLENSSNNCQGDSLVLFTVISVQPFLLSWCDQVSVSHYYTMAGS